MDNPMTSPPDIVETVRANQAEGCTHGLRVEGARLADGTTDREAAPAEIRVDANFRFGEVMS
jgi:hypothetical protein